MWLLNHVALMNVIVVVPCPIVLYFMMGGISSRTQQQHSNKVAAITSENMMQNTYDEWSERARQRVWCHSKPGRRARIPRSCVWCDCRGPHTHTHTHTNRIIGAFKVLFPIIELRATADDYIKSIWLNDYTMQSKLLALFKMHINFFVVRVSRTPLLGVGVVQGQIMATGVRSIATVCPAAMFSPFIFVFVGPGFVKI